MRKEILKVSPLAIWSLILTFIGTAINIWASIRMIQETQPANMGFLKSQQTVDKEAKATTHKKRTIAMTICGTTILLVASVLSFLN